RAGPLAGLSAEDRALALAAPVPAWRLPMPRLAPHLARELARDPGGAQIATTLAAPLQRAIEAIAENALETLPERASVAILIADLATREVRALVGGAWGEE